MEKRLVIFLICSVLVLTGHMLLTRMLFPPRPVVRQEPDQEPGAEDAPGPDQVPPAADPQDPAAAAPDTPETGAGTAPTAELPASDDQAPEAARPGALPDVPQQWMTLGSCAPESPYPLLVTLTNRGASIERVELVERRPNGQLRYRDLDTQFGYSGLQCQDTEQGCVVTVIGPGTPAAVATASDASIAAGVQPGDVLETLDGVKITGYEELQALFKEAGPDQIVELGVRRQVGDTTRQLTFSLKLAVRPLALIRPESLPALRPIPSYLLGLTRVGSLTPARGSDELAGLPSLREAHWEVLETTVDSVAFRCRLAVGSGAEAGEIELIKRFRIGSDALPEGDDPDDLHPGYSVQMTIELANRGTSPQVIAYALDGANGLPTEGWWYSTKIHPAWGTAGARDVIWRVQGNRHSLKSASQIYKEAQKKEGVDAMTSVLTDNPSLEERTLDYLGNDTQYFSAVLMAGTADAPRPLVCQQAYAMPAGPLPELKGNEVKTLNTTCRLVSPDETLEPGKTATHDYHIFLGPKAPELLQAYQLADIMEYGWFGWIAKPLSRLLHLFYAIVRNYGLAIILLTVLVRGAMFPIGRKAARNAQMMQELAPEIKKIKEKYKNDLEKQGQAQRELWKKYNFNPLGGCWLMFLQLPIFIGLYRCLSVDIELRQAALIPGIQWSSNLAGPDMAWYWKGILPDFLASETGWLGPYLNIFPIITIVLFIVQQKMFTPPATDDQTRMQQNMMQYMMIFMGVLFFKVPAGLCVYFIASSLWGIGERKLLPPPTTPVAAPKDKLPAKKSSWTRLAERVMNRTEAETVEDIRARRKTRR
ncbi:MAG: YidC/Oxa1 family insertase periplasmic-domain containing protein [Pirellulaceae bacterium]